MHLETLDIYQVRNLIKSRLEFCSGANFFSGNNGSGKTSVLEAIHLLARGRSFRSRNIRTVIAHDIPSCTVSAKLFNDGVYYSLGVKRERGGSFVCKHNGGLLSGVASLAELLPLQLINNESFDLLEGGPLNRRQFIDWGVFHVEHSYKDLWKHFQRCLRQRNSLLRRDRIEDEELAVWNAEFARLSEQVSELRERYLKRFEPVFKEVLQQLSELDAVSIRYYSGWDKDKAPLDHVLRESERRDRQNKTTNYGAHRADLRINIDGRPASEVLSRGQIKIVVCALKIAQGYLYKQEIKKECIYLLDDLASELDDNHRRRVGKLLYGLGAQVFITGVFEEDLRSSWPKEGDSRMFHVEHGEVTALNN